MDEYERYANGIDVRRAVLGDKHVNRAIEKRIHSMKNSDLITRYAWGEFGRVPDCPDTRGA